MSVSEGNTKSGDGNVLTELVALKRSAHHAFIEWLCGWKERPTLFVNNVLPSNPPRFGNLTVYHKEKIGAADLCQFETETSKALTQDKYDLLVNFEGRSIDNIVNLNELIPKYWGNKNIKCILFLREPLNNFASLTKRLENASFTQHLKTFFQILRFCEYIDTLKYPQNGGASLFSDVILFSAWQRDDQYRRTLAERYDLNGTALKSTVPAFGGGSSFEGVTFDPVKEQEKLFARWREMRDDPFFLSLFLNHRVFQAIETYYDMFGSVEPVKKSVLYDLRRAARGQPEAVKLCRIWLDGFEKSYGIYNGVERESSGAFRGFWRGYLKSMIAVRRFIYGSFSALAMLPYDTFTVWLDALTI